MLGIPEYTEYRLPKVLGILFHPEYRYLKLLLLVLGALNEILSTLACQKYPEYPLLKVLGSTEYPGYRQPECWVF